jgi:hypothetical protein
MVIYYMKNLSENTFKELARIRQPLSISIYIPTHRSGQEVNEKIDQINLKNQIQQVVRELKDRQLDDGEIEQLIGPVNKLVNDSGFWHNQAGGLAIFCYQNSFEYYILPIEFQEFTYVSDHLYLKPLISYLNDNCTYYLLALSLSEAKIYEGFSHQIREIDVPDLLPEKLEEVVGYDFKETHLQFRTGQTGTETTLYHGHGKGKEDEKNEIKKYFREVNNGLMKVIKNRKRPLVVATVDYLFPIYKEVNEYQNLWKGFIAGNPENEDPELLHNNAMALLQDYFSKKRLHFWDVYDKAIKDNLVSFNEEEIILAAFDGRIKTLFADSRGNLWGFFDPDRRAVRFGEHPSQFKSCLMNFAAVQTILHGGHTYLVEPGEMPNPGTKLNAIYRF